MPNITRDELPAENWKHRYQVGFMLFRWRGRPVIFWRTVSQGRFLADMYRLRVTQNSHPLDVLALFHSGMIENYKRTFFRALRA